jgi:hypothetical protein
MREMFSGSTITVAIACSCSFPCPSSGRRLRGRPDPQDQRRGEERAPGFFDYDGRRNVVSTPSLVVSGRFVSRLIKSGPFKAGSSCVAPRRGISRLAKGHPNTVPFFARPQTQRASQFGSARRLPASDPNSQDRVKSPWNLCKGPADDG